MPKRNLNKIPPRLLAKLNGFEMDEIIAACTKLVRPEDVDRYHALTVPRKLDLQSAFNSIGEPTELPSLVVFADILGFKRHMMDAVSGKRSGEALLAIREALDDACQFLVPDDFDSPAGHTIPRLWDLKMFTDNFVMGHPIRAGGQDAETELGSALFALIQFQSTMARHAHFVRGGIALGDLYMDRDIVWGSGLIRAYQFEEQGGPPCLVLGTLQEDGTDSTLLGYVFRHLSYYDSPTGAPHNRELLVDVTNATIFVDYLSSFVYPADDDGPPEPDSAALRQHKDLIEARLRQYCTDQRIGPKYDWLAAYHNFCIAECSALGADLFVDMSLCRAVPAHFKRLGSLFPSRADLTTALPWLGR